MRLNLGAADRHFPGYLSVDIAPPADVVADLREPWPWGDSSVDEILAYDVIEHLPDKRHTMNEMWRVLKPGARATIQVPDASEGDGAFCDPTHISFWTRSSFEYFAIGVFERERFRNSEYYGVRADFRVANLGPNGIPRTKHQRVFGGYVMEMQVILEAVK